MASVCSCPNLPPGPAPRVRSKPAATRTFYRVLVGTTAAERDFWSKAAFGEPLQVPHTARRGRLHIAKLVIPVDGPITFEQTGLHPEHLTLWGDPPRCWVV